MSATIKLYLDRVLSGGAACRLESAERVYDRNAVEVMGGDKLDLRVYWLDFEADETGADVAWAAGYEVSASLIDKNELAEADPQEMVRTLAFAVDEDTDLDDRHYYYGLLSLAGASVAAALASVASVDAYLDVRVASTAAERQVTYRIPVRLLRPAEGLAPSDGEVGTTMANVDGANLRQTAAGVFQILDDVTGLYRTLICRDGVLAVAEGEA
jgi:hypothetical protein